MDSNSNCDQIEFPVLNYRRNGRKRKLIVDENSNKLAKISKITNTILKHEFTENNKNYRLYSDSNTSISSLTAVNNTVIDLITPRSEADDDKPQSLTILCPENSIHQTTANKSELSSSMENMNIHTSDYSNDIVTVEDLKQFDDCLQKFRENLIQDSQIVLNDDDMQFVEELDNLFSTIITDDNGLYPKISQ